MKALTCIQQTFTYSQKARTGKWLIISHQKSVPCFHKVVSWSVWTLQTSDTFHWLRKYRDFYSIWKKTNTWNKAQWKYDSILFCNCTLALSTVLMKIKTEHPSVIPEYFYFSALIPYFCYSVIFSSTDGNVIILPNAISVLFLGLELLFTLIFTFQTPRLEPSDKLHFL